MTAKNKRHILIAMVIMLAMVGAAFVGVYGATASQKRAQANAAGDKADSLYKQVGEAEDKITSLEKSISSKESEIAATKVALDAKEKEVNSQTESLKDRKSTRLNSSH